ncbi:helix-turn-helix domain-containing protein [Streptomyces sp. NPDC002845]
MLAVTVRCRADWTQQRGGNMPSGGRPTVRSRRLGSALRRFREGLRLDLKDAAEAVGCSTSKISRLESGQSAARVGDVRILLDLYQVEDAERRAQLEHLARQSNKRGWWVDYQTTITSEFADFVTLEADASLIRTWQNVFVPGILQTPAYTRALIEAGPLVVPEEDIEEIVKIRQERQRAIEETGALFAAVIWEPALTSPMPDRSAHLEQLEQIIRIAQQKNTTIQVLPQSEWGAARIAGHFVTFSFGNESAPEVVAIDSLNNTVIIEDADELANYAYVFDALRSAALTPGDSLAYLRRRISKISQEEEEE